MTWNRSVENSRRRAGHCDDRPAPVHGDRLLPLRRGGRLIAHSPAVHVRRPRIDFESHAIGLDSNEVGALLVAAGLGPAGEHARSSLLALNGLRVAEAIGANIEALGVERGHRTLTVLRKGGKTVTVPPALRTARAVDLAVGERAAGPIFVAGDGRRLDRHGAARIVRRVARRAGIAEPIGPHTLRQRSSPPLSTLACRCATSKRPHHTPIRAPPCATTGPGSRSTVTPPTSCPPPSPAPPADRLSGRQKTVCGRPGPATPRQGYHRVWAGSDGAAGDEAPPVCVPQPAARVWDRCGWIVSPRASMSMNFSSRRARVSARLAVVRR